MIDIHSHILPGVDDGSKTNKMSKALIEQMISQGITSAIATPHFYPEKMDLDEFLNRRQIAYDDLVRHLGESQVKILLGAEILYFKDISKASDIKALTLPGGKHILLEFLSSKDINNSAIDDIISIKKDMGITPIIAHIERYHRHNSYKKLFPLLRKGIALCQINATFTTSYFETRAVKRLLKEGLVTFIASDCHNLKFRAVQIKTAFDAVKKMSPEEAKKIINRTENFEREMLSL